MPNVIKEALACNLLVASVDVGDVRARIGMTQNYRVCENDDPHEIAEAMVEVLVVFTGLLLRLLLPSDGLDTFRRGKDLGRGREA